MRTFTILVCLLFTASTLLTAQSEEDRAKAVKEAAAKAENGWKVGASFGLDLSGMGLFNPRQGAGGNRFGIGGVGSINATRKADKSFWSNQFDMRLGAQRIEVADLSGPTPTIRKDFVKNLDLLRLNSRYGYSLAGTKLFIAIDAVAETFLLPTYPGNTLKPVKTGDKPTAKFFNPLTIDLSPGIDFKPSDHLSFFYSPASVRYIFVGSDSIAAKFIHITEAASRNQEGREFLGIGSKLRANYANKYFKDKVAVSSNLSLFSNYLKTPQNIDVLWNNTVDIQLFKGLSLSLLGELFYDNDVNVQIDRNKNNIFGETGELAPAASITGAFLLKYSRIF
jgi:hypothetical protein